MKTKIISLASILLLFISCSPSTDEAVNYNDKLVNEQILVATSIDSLNELISNKDTTQIKSYYQKLSNTIITSTNKIDRYDNFDNNSDYKNSIKKLFQAYQKICDNEYKDLINICYLPDTLFTQDTLNFFNITLNKINEKIAVQTKEFNTFQENFAKKYNFTLIDKK
jgi:hypothetical protein